MASAQGDYEAFTFSQADYLGTARFMGAGGAFGATGGDFSALSTNPAAIGLFKRYEASITPLVLSFGYSDTYYSGEKSSSQKFKYTVPQAGIVMSRNIRRENESFAPAADLLLLFDMSVDEALRRIEEGASMIRTIISANTGSNSSPAPLMKRSLATKFGRASRYRFLVVIVT